MDIDTISIVIRKKPALRVLKSHSNDIEAATASDSDDAGDGSKYLTMEMLTALAESQASKASRSASCRVVTTNAVTPRQATVTRG